MEFLKLTPKLKDFIDTAEIDAIGKGFLLTKGSQVIYVHPSCLEGPALLTQDDVTIFIEDRVFRRVISAYKPKPWCTAEDISELMRRWEQVDRGIP